MAKVTACPNCQKRNLYQAAKEISSGGGQSPNYLPGLGGFFKTGHFRIIVCSDCGLTRFFTSREALDKLPESDKWHRVTSVG